MTTIVADSTKGTSHLPTPVLLVGIGIIGLVVGLIVGFAAASATQAPSTAAPTNAQVVADNALVDRWMEVQNGGDRADVEAMLRPNFRYQDNIGLSQRTAAGMWAQILDSRNFGDVHERTTDVYRIGDVLFWGARYTTREGAVHAYTWMLRLDQEGRFVNAWATAQ